MICEYSIRIGVVVLARDVLGGGCTDRNDGTGCASCLDTEISFYSFKRDKRGPTMALPKTTRAFCYRAVSVFLKVLDDRGAYSWWARDCRNEMSARENKISSFSAGAAHSQNQIEDCSQEAGNGRESHLVDRGLSKLSLICSRSNWIFDQNLDVVGGRCGGAKT
jgi:hypothetical protein